MLSTVDRPWPSLIDGSHVLTNFKQCSLVVLSVDVLRTSYWPPDASSAIAALAAGGPWYLIACGSKQQQQLRYATYCITVGCDCSNPQN